MNTEDNNTDTNCKCSNCIYFESRTSFCRLNPPQITVNKDGYYVSCFPKISMPMLDFCFQFKDKNQKEQKIID